MLVQKELKNAYIGSNNTPRLPSAYQEVEWIQSSGTQYINTGYTPLTTTEFDITYEWVSFVNQYQTPIGTRRNYNNQAYYFGWDSVNNRSFYGFGTNHVDPSSVAFGGLGPKFNITYKNGVISNGNQTANVTVSNAPYGNLCIFAEEHNGNVQEYGNMKLYGLKLYESGTLIRDFVPCYRIADSVIGLYDVVNDVFYTNNGTGTFTKGPDANLPYKEIKKVYLGSTQVRPASAGMISCDFTQGDQGFVIAEAWSSPNGRDSNGFYIKSEWSRGSGMRITVPSSIINQGTPKQIKLYGKNMDLGSGVGVSEGVDTKVVRVFGSQINISNTRGTPADTNVSPLNEDVFVIDFENEVCYLESATSTTATIYSSTILQLWANGTLNLCLLSPNKNTYGYLTKAEFYF